VSDMVTRTHIFQIRRDPPGEGGNESAANVEEMAAGLAVGPACAAPRDTTLKPKFFP
jgi:hypothetical protein